MSIDLSGLPEPTGYSTTEVYYGTRFKQGGRTNYLLDLSPAQIMGIVPRPNPDVATETNRRINSKHASDFADYQRSTPEWVVPGILLRTEHPLKFQRASSDDSPAEIGTITFSKSATPDLHILDGQHRILGFFRALETTNAEMARLQDSLSKAKRMETAGEKEIREAIRNVEAQAKRLTEEHVAVQVIVEEDPAKYRQMFFDIAENAKGIGASVRARFDSRKAVNRALEEILRHPLLANRVDIDRDRLTNNSPDLFTVKHVAEITRALTVGFEGRVGKRTERMLDDKDIAIKTKAFFDLLVESFPQYEAILNNQMRPRELREGALLGNAVFVRMLAAVAHDLAEESAWTREMIGDFFKKIGPHANSTAHENSIWWTQIGSPNFALGQVYPSTRRQDAVEVVETLKAWAKDKPKFLDQKPKAAPRPPIEPVDVSDDEADEILRPEVARARRELATKP